MQINGMNLGQYSDYMQKKHSGKRHEKFSLVLKDSGKTGYELRECSFQEMLENVIRGHEIIKEAGR